MRDYWLTQYLLAAIGWGYLVFCLLALAIAAWLPKRKTAKVGAALAVLALASVLPIRGYRQYLDERAKADVVRARHGKALSLLQARCETAGEKIYRTVESVEGILLQGTRGTSDVTRYQDRDWEAAGFPTESTAGRYVMEFLYYHVPAQPGRNRELRPDPGGIGGYRYVDVELGARMRRYALRTRGDEGAVMDPIAQHGKELTGTGASPRHAVVYQNIADPEGRAHWIAGGTVKVIDRVTGETLGELTRYAFEQGFGSTAGERLPWRFAIQCPPADEGGTFGQIRSFVERVIKPKQGE